MAPRHRAAASRRLAKLGTAWTNPPRNGGWPRNFSKTATASARRTTAAPPGGGLRTSLPGGMALAKPPTCPRRRPGGLQTCSSGGVALAKPPTPRRRPPGGLRTCSQQEAAVTTPPRGAASGIRERAGISSIGRTRAAPPRAGVQATAAKATTKAATSWPPSGGWPPTCSRPAIRAADTTPTAIPVGVAPPTPWTSTSGRLRRRKGRRSAAFDSGRVGIDGPMQVDRGGRPPSCSTATLASATGSTGGLRRSPPTGAERTAEPILPELRGVPPTCWAARTRPTLVRPTGGPPRSCWGVAPVPLRLRPRRRTPGVPPTRPTVRRVRAAVTTRPSASG